VAFLSHGEPRRPAPVELVHIVHSRPDFIVVAGVQLGPVLREMWRYGKGPELTAREIQELGGWGGKWRREGCAGVEVDLAVIAPGGWVDWVRPVWGGYTLGGRRQRGGEGKVVKVRRGFG
jgi:hypothetical protein